MTETLEYKRALETKVARIQAGESYLEVHTKYVNGEKILEVFTLASLADVLGMPMSTMEGRYARARLHYWKVDVPTGSGRPTRGFHMAQLQDVVNLIRTPGAKVAHTPNGDSMRIKQRPEDVVPLIPTYFGNKPHFTLQSIAEHFGFSVTTIRNKLQRAGLMRRLVNLGSSAHGGRPTRAMPESAMGDVKLAIVDGVKFMTEIDRVLANTGTMRNEAKSYAKEHIAPHTAPAATSMRAFDQQTLAPVIPIAPLNAVKSISAVRPGQQSSEEIGRSVAEELEAILSGAIKTGNPVIDAPSALAQPQDDEPDLSADEKAERAENQRKMKQMQFDALVGQVDEPSAAEMRETAEMLELSKADADRFVADIKLARQNRV